VRERVVISALQQVRALLELSHEVELLLDVAHRVEGGTQALGRRVVQGG